MLKLKNITGNLFSIESFLQESAGQACFVVSIILIMKETLKFRSRKTIQYINVHAKVVGKDLIFSYNASKLLSKIKPEL